MAIAHRQIHVDDLVFEADIVGPDDGELVLFLHGFPLTRYAWRAELPAIAAAGFRGCAYDQRGYSPGARPGEIDAYRVELLVDDALGVAEALGARRFHVVGHDWGGALAWILAALHPDRLLSVAVLSRPHPQAFTTALRNDEDQPNKSRHHRAFLDPAAAEDMLAGGAARLRRLPRIPDRVLDVYLATLGDRDTLDAAMNWYRAVGSSAWRSGEIPDVVIPTLYVWGNEDSTVSRFAAETTADHVTGPYRFVELPNVNHFITDEVPGTVPPLLIEHLLAAGATTGPHDHPDSAAPESPARGGTP